MKVIIGLICLAIAAFGGFMSFLSFAFSMGNPTALFYVVALFVIALCGIIGTIVSFNAKNNDEIGVAVGIGIIIPIVIYFFMAAQSKKESDAFKQSKLDYENSAVIKTIPPYSYKVYPDGNFSPIDVCDDGYNASECIKAIKVWDLNH